MEAVFGKSTCINSWMQLVRKVSWNFPGLETEECIGQNPNFIVRNDENRTKINAFLKMRIDEHIEMADN